METSKEESGGVADDTKSHTLTGPNDEGSTSLPQKEPRRRPLSIETAKDSEMPPRKKLKADGLSLGSAVPLSLSPSQPNSTSMVTGTMIAPAAPSHLVSPPAQSTLDMSGIPSPTATPPSLSTFTWSHGERDKISYHSQY